MNTTCSV